jgi:uncharacterized membrane protein YhaH (DUF805 family)
VTEVAHARPGFAQSVVRALRRYTDFEGRATRAEFWWYALFYALVLTFCDVFSFAQLSPTATLGSVLSSIFMIVTLLPTLAIGVRRLRDAGLGWKNMFWLLVPVAGIIILIVYWTRPSKPDASWDTARWSL